jgi:excisionase family DNA binding protein
MAMNRVETLERLRQELALRGRPTPGPVASNCNTASWEDSDAGVIATALPAKPTHSMLMTVPEVCAELRISRAQFYILANKHKAIETIHIGKLCRIPRKALEEYVDGLRSGVQL